MTNYSGF